MIPINAVTLLLLLCCCCVVFRCVAELLLQFFQYWTLFLQRLHNLFFAFVCVCVCCGLLRTRAGGLRLESWLLDWLVLLLLVFKDFGCLKVWKSEVPEVAWLSAKTTVGKADSQTDGQFTWRGGCGKIVFVFENWWFPEVLSALKAHVCNSWEFELEFECCGIVRLIARIFDWSWTLLHQWFCLVRVSCFGGKQTYSSRRRGRNLYNSGEMVWKEYDHQLLHLELETPRWGTWERAGGESNSELDLRE